MKVLRVGERVWLVLDDGATRIHFVIEYGPAVLQRTHETLMMYRVDHWVVRRSERWPLGFYDELRRAVDACALSLGMPNFLTPVTAPDGSIVTPDEQRARWQSGRDPRTGLPEGASSHSGHSAQGGAWSSGDRPAGPSRSGAPADLTADTRVGGVGDRQAQPGRQRERQI